ncbi:hybrid sensor histidine kinase/response regulator [Streptomyces tateyamensis]|uniref:Circadian input-output histidine kinase CikA n=1 Tax=Streptomyces tateyamensis TaxID=565073 RepID=A0A2V4P9Y3_9ACTN|nr:ATP-binding protein [Streptomyces tateyamensis]PYC87609.1 hybrid sensor histidine kinase/response regulator [Streptomyces tateyamensis]
MGESAAGPARPGEEMPRRLLAGLTAVRDGDFALRLPANGDGLVGEIGAVYNGMVDQLALIADEVTRVAREVGTEGRLGGQAAVPGVGGTWKDLTENVNVMAHNLTGQVRSISQVATAVARGDLSQKVTVDARGEMLELKETINTMVERLSAFAGEVTRVAREVGSEGRLGGQAEVEGVSGTWKRLTENVNELAGNLTRQVRAIAEVTGAVAAGDLTRSITVDASGEVADLKDNVNSMVRSLRETTRDNEEQDWLKTNLARLTTLVQGERDVAAVAELVMAELTPLVSAQYGAFYLADDAGGEAAGGGELVEIAGYATAGGAAAAPRRFRSGQSLVGQVARDRRTVLVRGVPAGYATVCSGTGAADPVELVLLPILTEDQLLGVVEFASVRPFDALRLDLLERFAAAVGASVSSLLANARTDELLQEARRLTAELRASSAQLQDRQGEPQASNAELAEQAEQLAERNRDIEAKNRQIEQARQELEDRAHQLSQTSMYKSEFLANMSHELRTPLNSLLILAQLLAQNGEENLTPKQVEYANVIHSAGSDLLQLINDILDLSKVEAGKVGLSRDRFAVRQLLDQVALAFRPQSSQLGLEFSVRAAPDVPAELVTDEARLRQVLRNLLANALKFTEAGRVELRVERAVPTQVPAALVGADQVLAFVVEDTGIGIADRDREGIFTAFEQADGTAGRRYGGTGLGLSISRELAQLLGGAITVDSRLGEGSRFTLFLPVGGSPDPQPRPGSQAAPAPAPLPAPVADDEGLRGHTVLVVDDDIRTVFALSGALEQAGLRVLHAENGRACVDLLRGSEDVELVLMDLMMPELDGYAAIPAVRAMPQYAEIPIIALTAKAMPGDRAKSLAAGADDHVTKPVEVAELLSRLRHWLGRS